MSIKKTNRFYLFFTILEFVTTLGLIALIIPKIGSIETSTIVMYLICFVIGCILIKRDNSEFLEVLPYNKGMKPVSALCICGLVICLMPTTGLLSTIGSAIFGDVLNLVEKSGSLFNGNFFEMMFNVAVVPAVFEEMYFRGFFYSGYQKEKGARTAILLSAFLFGIFHMNFQQMIYACFLGIVLGILREITGGMWAGMLYHFVNNGIGVVTFFISEHIPTLDNNQAFAIMDGNVSTSPTSFILYAIAIIFGLGASIFLIIIIAKTEKRYDDLLRFFGKKKRTFQDDTITVELQVEEKEKLITPPLVIGIIIDIAVMLLFWYLMKSGILTDHLLDKLK